MQEKQTQKKVRWSLRTQWIVVNHIFPKLFTVFWVRDIGKKGIFQWFYGFLFGETLDFSCPKQLKRHWVLRRGNLTCNVILEKRQFLHYCMQAPSQSCLLFIRSQNKHSKPIFLGKRDYCGKIGNLWLFAPLSSSSVVDVHLEIPLERSRREASLSQMTRAIQSTSSLLFDYDRLALNQKAKLRNTTPSYRSHILQDYRPAQMDTIRSNYRAREGHLNFSRFFRQKCRLIWLLLQLQVGYKMNYGPFWWPS